jgi:hypothetical protein
MKYARFILPAFLLLPAFLFAQPGTSCSTPIALTLDNVIRTYTASSTTGNNVLCTDNGITPVTWFSFTSNATASCPLLAISVSDGLACEVAMYNNCSGAAAPIVTSSMCLDDGTGLWAPALPGTFTANTTYYLRIKTSTSCTISIGGQNYTPANDDCSGAFSIGTVGMTDNNSCHLAGPGVTAAQLCAFSLENTAFYQFYVATTGNCVINISNIACDNGANNNSNGFQIGFFSGTCASLNWISCTSGSGSFVQATTPTLAGGTKVYVAIDGNAGSNCAYTIGGINILGVLSKSLKNFSGWIAGSSNILKWTILNETGGYYEVQRSENGVDFVSLGTIDSRGASTETTYDFQDHDPFTTSFYRLRQTDAEGKVSLSNILKIDRGNISKLQVKLKDPARDLLSFTITSATNEKYIYRIVNMQGQVLTQDNIFCIQGNNSFEKQISNLVPGQYYFVLDGNNEKIPLTKAFIKMN